MAVLQGCGGGGARVATPGTPAAGQLPTARSVSPASIKAPPMAPGAGGSVAAMSAKRHASGFIQPASWTQLPGGAVFTSIAPDGSVWALGLDGPGNGDHYIYHYASGTWTSSPGAASRLAIAPNGTPWAVTAAGGIYSYQNGTWSALAGGASDISIASDNTVLVISNQPGNAYGNGIWHYAGGAWSQLPGAGVRIALSWDQGSYPGGFTPGGWYIVNALNGIYYYSPGAGYIQVPGAASFVAPTRNGGLFALGVPDGSGASSIYYLDLVSKTWVQEPGAATSLSTDGTKAYVTGAGGGLYTSPVTAALVGAAPVAGYLAATNSGSFAGQLTSITSGATVVGISTTELADSGSSFLNTGNLAFSVGSSVLSTQRQPLARRNTLATAAVNHPDIDGPTEGPAEIAKLESQLRRAPSGTRIPLSAMRRTSTLGTTVGSPNSFWVTVFSIGTSNGTDKQVPATLQATTSNGYLWVDNTLNLDAGTIAKLASDLDNAYASDTAHYGPTQFTAAAPYFANRTGGYQTCDASGNLLPGSVPWFVVPPDAKVNALVINTNNLGSGVGGYFTSTNYYYQSAFNCLIGQPDGAGGIYNATTIPHSNEAPLIYVGYNNKNSTDFETDEDLVRGTAHELQHLINFVDHRILHDTAGEKRWINEGMSMLAQDFAVNRKFGLAHDVQDALYRASQYTGAPQNFALTSFTGIDPSQSTPHYNCSGCYGASYLFQRYLYDRFGGDAYLHAMLGSTTNFTALQAATGTDPHTLLSDFAIALAASGTGATSDARFTLGTLNLSTSYPDQFGNSYPVGPPATSPLGAGASPYVGSFSYYSVGASALNQNLSGKDLGGGFGLQVGVVQR